MSSRPTKRRFVPSSVKFINVNEEENGEVEEEEEEIEDVEDVEDVENNNLHVVVENEMSERDVGARNASSEKSKTKRVRKAKVAKTNVKPSKQPVKRRITSTNNKSYFVDGEPEIYNPDFQNSNSPVALFDDQEEMVVSDDEEDIFMESKIDVQTLLKIGAPKYDSRRPHTVNLLLMANVAKGKKENWSGQELKGLAYPISTNTAMIIKDPRNVVVGKVPRPTLTFFNFKEKHGLEHIIELSDSQAEGYENVAWIRDVDSMQDVLSDGNVVSFNKTDVYKLLSLIYGKDMVVCELLTKFLKNKNFALSAGNTIFNQNMTKAKSNQPIYLTQSGIWSTYVKIRNDSIGLYSRNGDVINAVLLERIDESFVNALIWYYVRMCEVAKIRSSSLLLHTEKASKLKLKESEDLKNKRLEANNRVLRRKALMAKSTGGNGGGEKNKLLGNSFDM